MEMGTGTHTVMNPKAESRPGSAVGSTRFCTLAYAEALRIPFAKVSFLVNLSHSISSRRLLLSPILHPSGPLPIFLQALIRPFVPCIFLTLHVSSSSHGNCSLLVARSVPWASPPLSLGLP